MCPLIIRMPSSEGNIHSNSLPIFSLGFLSLYVLPSCKGSHLDTRALPEMMCQYFGPMSCVAFSLPADVLGGMKSFCLTFLCFCCHSSETVAWFEIVRVTPVLPWSPHPPNVSAFPPEALFIELGFVCDVKLESGAFLLQCGHPVVSVLPVEKPAVLPWDGWGVPVNNWPCVEQLISGLWI